MTEADNLFLTKIWAVHPALLEYKPSPGVSKVGKPLMGDLLSDHKVILAIGNRLTLIAFSYLPAFSKSLVGAFTSEQEALNALATRQPTLLLVSEDLEVGYGISLVSTTKQKYPDIKCLLFIDRQHPDVIEEAVGAGADSVVRVSSMSSDGSGDFLKAISALSKGGVFFPEDVRRTIQDDTSVSERLELLAELTDREKEVLACVAEGRSNAEICSDLQISLPTTKSHISNLTQKLQVSSRTQLAILAIRKKLVNLV